jgi:hypothetical protein
MWTIAWGIVLGVLLLFGGLIGLSLVVNFFRWLSDIPGNIRGRRIHAHNALLAKHGLSPYDLTPEQSKARWEGAFIDPKDVKPRVRPEGRDGKVNVKEWERYTEGW